MILTFDLFSIEACLYAEAKKLNKFNVNQIAHKLALHTLRTNMKKNNIDSTPSSIVISPWLLKHILIHPAGKHNKVFCWLFFTS